MEQLLQVGVISSTHGIAGRSKSISYYRRSRSVQKIKTGDPGYRKRTERSGNRRGKIFQTVCDSEI